MSDESKRSIEPVAAKGTGHDGQVNDRTPHVEDARALYQDLRAKSETNEAEFRSILGQYEGKPPFSKDELEKAGRPGASNFNSGEFRGQISSAVRNAFKEETKVEIAASFSTNYGEEFERSPWMMKWSEIYTELLQKRWPDYHARTWLYIKERALHGHGPTYFTDPMSWQDKPIPSYSLLVPKGTAGDMSDAPYFMIYDSMPVYQFIELFEHKRREAEAAGRKGPVIKAHRIDSWNLTQVKSVIEGLASNKDEYHSLPVFDMENIRTKPESITLQDFTNAIRGLNVGLHDNIPIVRYFVRDFNGSWTEKIFTHSAQHRSKDGHKNEVADAFLFEEELPEETTINDILLVNPHEVSFFHHDAKGLGALVSGPAMWRDVLMNKSVDSVFLQMALVLQSVNEASAQKQKNIKFSWDTVEIPPDFEVVRQQFGGDINNALGLADRIAEIGTGNTVHNMNAAMGRDQNTKTARQFHSEEVNAQDLLDQEADFFKVWMQKAHAARIRRIIYIMEQAGLPSKNKNNIEALNRRYPGIKILNDALLKAREAGVPMGAIKGIDPDTTVAHSGVSVQKLFAIQDLAMQEPRSREWYRRKMFVSLFGATEASQAIALYNEDDEATDPAVQKALTTSQREHGSFYAGYQVVPHQNEQHIAAAEFHLRHLQEVIGRYLTAPENPASTSNDPNSPEAEVARKVPSELAGGALSLEEKLQIFKESYAIWQHCMSRPDEEGGFAGHLYYAGMMTGVEERVRELFVGFNEILNALNKLNNELQESAAAEVNAIKEAAQGPSFLEREKVKTEQIKQQLMLSEAQIKQAIKIDDHEIDQRIALERHDSDERSRDANRRFQAAEKQRQARNRDAGATL